MNSGLSHLVCPLCGKNAPLSTFDPSGFDLDLRLVSFRGLGRGKGFSVSEEFSILGDDEISPKVARRTLSLCKMFLEAEMISRESLIDELGLKSEFVAKSTFDAAVGGLNERIKNDAEKLSIFEAVLTSYNEKIHDLKKKMESRYKVEKALGKIIYICKPIINFKNEVPWSLVLYDTDISTQYLLTQIIKELDHCSRLYFFERVKPGNLLVLEMFSNILKKIEQAENQNI